MLLLHREMYCGIPSKAIARRPPPEVQPMADARISDLLRPTGKVRTGAGLLSGTVARLASLSGLWLARRRNRRQLSALTVEQMRDTGLDPEWVRRESGKPFWRR
jgi:uncharacterized protein YjiS (DUF1127 family)